MNAKTRVPPWTWCSLLSTEGHKHCRAFANWGPRGSRGCDCPCHLEGMWSNGGETKRRRPHSYPRGDWARRQPAGTAERRRLQAEQTRRTW